jgi:hypothetical protein
MSLFRRAFNFCINRALELPSRLGCRLIALPLIASRLDAFYEKEKRKYAGHLPPVNQCDRAIIDGLRTSGVFVTSLDALGIPETAHFLEQADTLQRQHLPICRSFQAGANAIMAFPTIFHWGLQDRLLNVVENYLGMPVGYDGINIFFTAADGHESGARLWHRDSEDQRMVKIAVYIHDVDQGAGPFQVLRRRVPKFDDLARGVAPVLTQRELEENLPDFDMERDVVTCTGKRGTVIFSDTASFYHRGMPATTGDRYAIFFNYMCRVPLRPFRCERTMISRAQVNQMAKGLPERQRNCVLWRTALPRIARIIPPAPVVGRT